MSEADFQNQILDLCKHMGLLAYHVYDSRRSVPGFPDLVIVGKHGILYRELKTDKGRVSADQDQWLEALHGAGGDASVWRPRDWPTRVQRELKELGSLDIKPRRPTQDEIRAHLQRGRASA